MNQFKTWIHGVALAIIGAVTTYATNDAVHAAVNVIVAGHPKLVAIAAAVTAIGLAYADSRKSS